MDNTIKIKTPDTKMDAVSFGILMDHLNKIEEAARKRKVNDVVVHLQEMLVEMRLIHPHEKGVLWRDVDGSLKRKNNADLSKDVIAIAVELMRAQDSYEAVVVVMRKMSTATSCLLKKVTGRNTTKNKKTNTNMDAGQVAFLTQMLEFLGSNVKNGAVHSISYNLMGVASEMGWCFPYDENILFRAYTNGMERDVLNVLLETSNTIYHELMGVAQHLGGVYDVKQTMSEVISYLEEKATNL